MEKSDSIVNIIKALSDAQSEFAELKKNKYNSHLKYYYADLDSMKNSTMPSLKKHGLTLNFFPETCDGINYMKACLMHTSGEYIFTRYAVLPEKQGMQGTGSAFTYLKRYMWGSIFSLYDDENDDAVEETINSNSVEKEISPKENLSQNQLNFLAGLLNQRGITIEEVYAKYNMQSLGEINSSNWLNFIQSIKKDFPKA